MNDLGAGLVVLCIFTVVFGSVFGFFAYLRYMRYKETLALADKGLVPARYERNGKGTLRWGIVITAIGAALCLGLYPVGWVVGDTQFPLNFGPWMLIGLLPTFFGLALIAIYLITRNGEAEQPELEPGEVEVDEPVVVEEAPDVPLETEEVE